MSNDLYYYCNPIFLRSLNNIRVCLFFGKSVGAVEWEEPGHTHLSEIADSNGDLYWTSNESRVKAFF